MFYGLLSWGQIRCMFILRFIIFNIVNKLNDEFIATYVIENAKGGKVRSFQLIRKKPGDTCTLSLGVPVEGLAEGEYRLILTVEDPAQAQSVSKSINLYVYVVKTNWTNRIGPSS